ncbi:MAG: universal stress protein [Pontiellaceae bacterium]|jgi:nucleotide-binding universal stress UspA family protein|nr:universal stress protein [Pontiellaceae bacterium]
MNGTNVMKIMATVDFSIASETILRMAKHYAEKLGAEVILVHAEPKHDRFDEEGYDTKPEVMRLKKDALALERTGIKVTSFFLQGPVCDMIINKALELKVDLIITGAHGHGGGINCKMSVGHISECLLLKSKIPVLVVPA